ncbi:hypothetical protein [Streptomyces sp. enrichment culture]|uniref:hypothetical protein n=1 Tax=Streptomyces sp. enrichment culture TaxID=1795815 RepID=UPI003F570C24
MERRSALAAGVALGTGLFADPVSAWAAPMPRLSAGDATACAYARLDEMLPLLLAGTARSTEQGPADAALATDVWVLASQLAVTQTTPRPPAPTRAGSAPRSAAPATR